MAGAMLAVSAACPSGQTWSSGDREVPETLRVASTVMLTRTKERHRRHVGGIRLTTTAPLIRVHEELALSNDRKTHLQRRGLDSRKVAYIAGHMVGRQALHIRRARPQVELRLDIKSAAYTKSVMTIRTLDTRCLSGPDAGAEREPRHATHSRVDSDL